jgi:hypothetical protein
VSNRTLLEFNHDYAPKGDEVESFAHAIARYLRSGDPTLLPRGVTYFGMRHHSTPCPLGEPPRGWNNRATFDSPQEASRSIRRPGVKSYRCPDCGKWHNCYGAPIRKTARELRTA